MLCAKLDNELGRLARKHRCRYTRYADDLTFSTDSEYFPSALAKYNSQGALETGEELRKIIADNGFTIAVQKLRLRRKNVRQQVTGLIVNRGVNVKPEYVRQIRAMLHAWEKYGLVNAERKFLTDYYRPVGQQTKATPQFFNVVQGKLAFLKMVVTETDPTYKYYHDKFTRLSLLERFNIIYAEPNHNQRGYLFEKFVNRLFQSHGIKTEGSFKRNEGAEQIDGAFKMGDVHFLVECKWREQPSEPKDTNDFYTKITRSGALTMGLFISLNGWTKNVVETLKQNQTKVIILANGDCIKGVLGNKIDLMEFLAAKKEYLSLRAEPFCSVDNYLARHTLP